MIAVRNGYEGRVGAGAEDHGCLWLFPCTERLMGPEDTWAPGGWGFLRVLCWF